MDAPRQPFRFRTEFLGYLRTLPRAFLRFETPECAAVLFLVAILLLFGILRLHRADFFFHL